MGKLRGTIQQHAPDADEREWVEPRLQHILGLTDRVASDGEDLHSAWRLFFERMAETGPVVLLFEDLHWADTALLDFIEYLLDWSRSYPIYVLTLSRPELGERHPTFGTRVRSSTVLTLEPLGDEAMESLLSGLVPGLSGVAEVELESILASLVRKELLTIQTDPRSPERGQYGFLQALVQRVAYDTLARRDRKARHLAAARFLEGDAGFDQDEIAEVIAAHYSDAHTADPQAEDADVIKARARDWLCRAGERAAALAAPEDAGRAFDRAAELADGDEERARMLERAGEMLIWANDSSAAEGRLSEARALFESAGLPHDS